MKTLVVLFMAVLFAVPAMASQKQVVFPLWSSASAGTVTSSVVNASGFKYKTVIVNGATLTSTAASITYKNMSGTIIAQCGPTSSGPWTTCNQGQSSAGADVSLTANDTMSWRDVVSYVRLKWTAGTLGTKIKAWLNLSD